jgi:hypothetical protein
MDKNYKAIVLNFDRAKQPTYNETRGKKFVEWGDDNNYPKYLLDLYNESPKHSAIVKSKCIYIYGKGFENAGIANTKGDNWNNILRKVTKDVEIYSGFALQIIWNRAKQINDVFHLDFHKVRASKDLTKFYIKSDWKNLSEKVREYDAFNIDNPVGSQIFYYKEYNPFSEIYPLPSYFACLNYISSDISVSRHILGNANQGFTGSKLINLNNGNPISEEHKGEVERDLLRKFTGDDGKRVVIMFNSSKDNAAEIVDLGNSMLTKEDFTNINNLIQQEIFAGHQVTSPALFGISTAGSLGQRNELRDAFEIFTKTYANSRQQELEEIITKLRNLKGEKEEFKIIPVEPLNFEFSEAVVSQNLEKDEIRAIMGKDPLENNVNPQAQMIANNINSLPQIVAQKVLDNMSAEEIRSLAGLVPASGQTAAPNDSPVQTPMQSNDALRNLTGRQYQNVMRIVRHFGNGKLSKQQAALMLKSGYGFSDADVNLFLGIDENPMTDDEVQKFFSEEDDRLFNAFASCGENFEDYEVVNRYPIQFADMVVLYQLESNIIELISNDPKLNADAIATALGKPVSDVQEALDSLIKKKVIEIKTKKVGSDVITENKILKPMSQLTGKEPAKEVESMFIRYTYEWRDIVPESQRDTAAHPSREFCKRMTALSASAKYNKQGRFWSMSDIQRMSAYLGYSVLDRAGGFWNRNGKIDYQCRHEWYANIVTKKK